MQFENWILSFKSKALFISVLIACSISTNLSAQIIFDNPSFEGGVNASGITAPLWNTCGGTPDLFPYLTAIYPSDGNSCVGMITKGPILIERIGQMLPNTLDSTKCYSFSIDLRNGNPYGPTFQPGRLLFWLGDSLCDKKSLVWTSPVISNSVYRTHDIFFQPNDNYTHAIFEIQATSNGIYNTGIALDNIHNEIVSSSIVNLGNDSLLCLGDSILLGVPGNDLTYLWRDGTTDSTLLVKRPGVYAITVTDLNGCQKRDNILISYSDTLNLGNDTILCDLDSILLDPKVAMGSFLWQDGSVSNNFFAKDSGLYHVTVTNQGCIQTDSILISKSEKIPFDLGSDTLLCFGDTLLLDVTVNGASYLWQNNSTASNFIVRNSGNYHVRMKQGNCFYFDTITVNFNTPVNADLGIDTLICIGDSVLLKINSLLGSTTKWSTTFIGDSIWVKQSGDYWVENSIGSCSISDTINVGFRNTKKVDVDLGNDTLICTNAIITLDATHPNATYLWQDLSNLNTYAVSKAGNYSVTVNENGCLGTDAISINKVETLDLGMDTIICSSENVFLNAFIPNSTYLWQDNETTNSVLTLDSGIYAVTVNTNGCIQTDSIYIEYFERPKFSLGNDTTICFPENLILNVAVPNATYSWQDGSTNASYTVNEKGLFFVELSQSNCVYRDTVNVDFKNLSFNLGNDTTLCLLDSLILVAIPPLGANVLWNNGITSNSIKVKQPGKYWAKISEDICESVDTIVVNYNNTTRPVINIGNDTLLCLSETILLDANWLNTSNYLWQDGSTNNNLLVNKPGLYAVTVSENFCSDSDSILINYSDSIDLTFPTNSFCRDGNLLLDFSYPNATYLWQDNSINSSYLVQDTGLYWVELNLNNCTYLSDSVYFFEIDCECLVELPNIFTPNGDGVNDLFFLESECSLKDYNLAIYNRYGKQILEFDNINFQWDGRIQGKELNSGVYFYVLTYRGVDMKLQKYHGSLTIMR